MTNKTRMKSRLLSETVQFFIFQCWFLTWGTWSVAEVGCSEVS